MNRRSALARITAAIAAILGVRHVIRQHRRPPLVAGEWLPGGSAVYVHADGKVYSWKHVNRGNIFREDWNYPRTATRKHWTQEDEMRLHAFAMQRKFKADVEAGRYDA